jgi:hypothetical protein
MFHDSDTEPNYPCFNDFPATCCTTPGAPRPPSGNCVPGRTDVLNEMATWSSAGMFFGLTFISKDAGHDNIPPKQGEDPKFGHDVAALGADSLMSPLEELAFYSSGKVYDVGEGLEYLQEAIDSSIEHYGESPQEDGDYDDDGLVGVEDNCPLTYNPSQADNDDDGVGNACDNCPNTYNPDQFDSDYDGYGDVCDEVLCGDANNDGLVNITDAVYVIQYIFNGGPGPVPYEAGDANCDGLTNVTDAVYLIQYIFNEGPEPCAEC